MIGTLLRLLYAFIASLFLQYSNNGRPQIRNDDDTNTLDTGNVDTEDDDTDRRNDNGTSDVLKSKDKVAMLESFLEITATSTLSSDLRRTKSDFIDTSTECAICLTQFDQEPKRATIALPACGHVWHADCLEQQFRTQSICQPGGRILWNGCRCAKCGTLSEDPPGLEHVVTPQAKEWKERVDNMILQQLRVDLPPGLLTADSLVCYRQRLLENGRRKYAFYLCSSCRQPYFGGTVDCATAITEDDGDNSNNNNNNTPRSQRTCPACTTHVQQVCRHAEEHGGHHVWKCRYCCAPATYLCYGQVHFCTDCHARNSALVLSSQRRNTGSSSISNQPPAQLSALTCPGGDACPYPKPNGQLSHVNGPTSDCEQVYECALCQSAPSRFQDTDIQPGSRNLLRNPCGEDGLWGWQQMGHLPWQVETSEVAAAADIRTNFVSSFRLCAMAQTVFLKDHIRAEVLAANGSNRNGHTVRVEVAAKFMGRTDCPSTFAMKALLINDERRVIQAQHIPPTSAPVDFWERHALILEFELGSAPDGRPLVAAARPHAIVVIAYGKDDRFWQGNFGSKVTDCSVRILGMQEELANLLIET